MEMRLRLRSVSEVIKCRPTGSWQARRLEHTPGGPGVHDRWLSSVVVAVVVVVVDGIGWQRDNGAAEQPLAPLPLGDGLLRYEKKMNRARAWPKRDHGM